MHKNGGINKSINMIAMMLANSFAGAAPAVENGGVGGRRGGGWG